MSREEAIAQLRTLQDPKGDTEGQHSFADRILCELLQDLGYSDVVREWAAVPKWYA